MKNSDLTPKHLTNRRTFIRQSSLGLGAAALATSGLSLSALSACAQDESGKKLGIALVGLGNYAKNQLAPALLETKDCYLAGIVTGTPAKAEEWKAKYNIPDKNIYNYENFDSIADNPDIDIVYVVLPNSMHAEYTIRAAKAGKHVICEKPMAVSVAEAEQMIAACKAAKRKLYIGYRLHYDPFSMEAMRIAKEKVYGEIKIVEASFGFRIGDPTQWRLRKNLAGGGAMMDVGIYVIQGARYSTNEEPIAVTAREYKTDPVKFAEVDETIFWQMEFPSGAVANCGTTYNSNIQRLYAAAENGWFDIRPVYSYSGLKGETSDGPMQIQGINQQAAHMDGVARSLKTGEADHNISGEEGLRDMKIIEAIYQSIAQDGKRITLG
ncbi:MAG: Gfo/Idh/MocA family oxidoreductase [Bacteroidia bacterium]